MTRQVALNPTHALIRAYHKELAAYAGQHVEHEGALRSAFQNLLADSGKLHGWTLIPELGTKAGSRTVRPDGTLRDSNSLPRGYWEAKDSRDSLNAEIARKVAKGYPLTNTIFENTREAVLYQGRQEALRARLSEPGEVATLLNVFFAHTEPDIRGFEEAVEEFRERVPELARGLAQKIEEAHRSNRGFIEAFEGFYGLCQLSLNPNIRREAVDEMLVQHLLTERLMRTIFDNADFTRRNAIAREVERVIDSLVGASFSRADFLKSLDPFYVAIERAARCLPDFSEKQHFLNTVYEGFFQGYCVKTADTHGIVYTPQPIADFMCASVARVLEEDFALPLGSAGVHILDPCTGTGNFIVNLLRRIPKRDLPRMYREQLFANEVMLLPYYIAALNIEHAHYELTGQYEPFEGLCFVDTLELAEDKQLPMFTEANTERVERERRAPITVILGNPPYNVGQLNENDNNKNRKYPVIDGRVSVTYARDSKATLKTQLYDAYVKFFRWAADRLGDRDGIVCFVSNNSFVDQIAFDGMRKHLLDDFTRIDHVDLHGNVRRNPKLSGTTHNVFGIQVGVGITLAVRTKGPKRLRYHRVPENWRKEEKLAWLAAGEVPWQTLKPDATHTWLVPEHAGHFARFDAISQIFELYSCGVKTNRDDVVYDFQREALTERVARFVDDYNAEVDRYHRHGGKAEVDEFVRYDRIKWSGDLKLALKRRKYAEFSEDKLRASLYRPFTWRVLYFDRLLNNSVYRQHQIFPTQATEEENCAIGLTGLGSEKPFMALVTKGICDLHFVGPGCGTQCFPFYTYAPDGSARKENITDEALERFRAHYQNTKIGKWDVFHYIYGVLHHAGYREKYADSLKRELPRIPLAPEFDAFAAAGRELARLHLDYEKLDPWALEWREDPSRPLSYRVEDKMRLSKDKTQLVVNPSLTLAGIPPEVFDYRLGNRSALEWVVDQYQVSEDRRSGIRSDPNREDDEPYIVRLAGQVVRVSLETVKIVRALPAFE
jgi:predicted helicase